MNSLVSVLRDFVSTMREAGCGIERTLSEERDPPRLGRERKREQTESAKEFPKASARPSPRGSLRRHGSEGPQATGSEMGTISPVAFWNNAHAESARLDLLCAGW